MLQTKPAYSRLSIGFHWLMVVLLVAVYACILLREIYPRGSDPREALKAWHFMLGLSVFLLVWARLLARFFTSRPATPRSWNDVFAAAMHVALYAFMIAMPLLGWLTLSAGGKPIPFFGLSLPALTAPNEALADQLKEVHETIGVIGYWLVGLHAGAALFHHYVLRDGTLKRMLGRRA